MILIGGRILAVGLRLIDRVRFVEIRDRGKRKLLTSTRIWNRSSGIFFWMDESEEVERITEMCDSASLLIYPEIRCLVIHNVRA